MQDSNLTQIGQNKNSMPTNNESNDLTILPYERDNNFERNMSMPLLHPVNEVVIEQNSPDPALRQSPIHIKPDGEILVANF